MAKMIPSYIQNSTTSSGEKRIFERLKNENNSSDWLVFHSLPLMKHPKNLEGEIDFLVVVPNVGIFCLEIKAGAVRRDNDRYWIYTNKYGKETISKKNPFEQARNEKFGILKWMKQNIPEKYKPSQLLVESIVVFTDIFNFDLSSTEWDPWQVCDKDKLHYCSFLEIFNEAVAGLIKKYNALYNNRVCYLHGPSKEISNIFEQLLLPAFEYTMVPHFKEDRIRLTQEQYDSITSVLDNDRLLINGLAGTGKTVIAIKLAHYFVEQGNKVLFLCFNKFLSLYLEDSVNDIYIDYVGTIDKFLFRLAKNYGLLPDKVDNQLFDKLPLILDNLSLKDEDTYDIIIVDEAQDIINEKYLKSLDKLLKNGLNNGKWVFVGDFDAQNIYGDKYDNPINLLNKSLDKSYVKFKLQRNCRNTYNICKRLTSMCNIDYRNMDILPKGNIVFYQYYNSIIEECTTILIWVSSLVKKYNNTKSVIILTYDNRHLQEIIKHFESLNISLSEYSTGCNNHLSISTIHKVKGLEFTNVCITGIESKKTLSSNLSYVGMSRANENLLLNMNTDLCDFVFGK